MTKKVQSKPKTIKLSFWLAPSKAMQVLRAQWKEASRAVPSDSLRCVNSLWQQINGQFLAIRPVPLCVVPLNWTALVHFLPTLLAQAFCSKKRKSLDQVSSFLSLINGCLFVLQQRIWWIEHTLSRKREMKRKRKKNVKKWTWKC